MKSRFATFVNIFRILPFVILALVLYKLTSDRLIPSKKISEPIPVGEENPSPPLPSSSADNLLVKTESALSPKEYDEWCQARDYVDLSSHEIFQKFDQWVYDFNKLDCLNEKNCTEHDPRKILQFHSLGSKLALERKDIFQKIIRGDPQKAIAMAIPQELSARFPLSIRQNIETWHSEKVDLKAIHVCFDPNHPEGLIKRFAKLGNGQQVRLWAYGKREKIKTIDGLAIWGVSLGDDFALADTAYQETSNQQEQPVIKFAGVDYAYRFESERELFIDELEKAERRVSFISRRVSYPIMAGSSSLSDYYDKKYDLILTPMTWHDANNTAYFRNGRLAVIESEKENDFIHDQFKDAKVNGFDSSGNQVNLAWIGATDSADQNGSSFDPETNASAIFEINATEGDWHWLDGKDINETISDFDSEFNAMWLGGIEPSNANKDFGAMDWSTAEGNWTDANETYRLPFIIEYDLGGEPAPNLVEAKGFRKVLVVPARFQDEGYGLDGNSAPLTDQFGNPIYPELVQDSFEPVSQANLASAMEDVVQYFSDNSDGLFQIIPVISSTVTVPIDKYEMTGSGGANLYDSSGQFIGAQELENEELDPFGGIGEWGVIMAAEADEKYDIHSHFFWGISSIELNGATIGSDYTQAPIVTFVGGNQNPNDNNFVHPDFEPCEARAIVNADGEITNIEILNPGAYYYSNPTVLINGSDQHAAGITATASNIAISWVTISTHTPGAAGVGYVGAQGSHVDATDGSVSWGVIAHELGHNFGLLHANRFSSRSERPNSDEGESYDYGNPFAVMGSGSGHMTLPAKVAMRANGFGYRIGTDSGVDVASLLDSFSLQSALTAGLNESDAENNNTFRIYRHDYHTFPASLIEGDFYVTFPSVKFADSNFDHNQTYSVSFDGTGAGAIGSLLTDDTNTGTLTISNGGKGFASDPTVNVLDENNQTLFAIAPAWIKVKAGTETYEQAVLRDLSESSVRGLRGLQFHLSPHSPIGFIGVNMDSMWLSYRRAASENGLSVLLGDGRTENFWIDMTPSTVEDFSDSFLMPGKTFSDYLTDVHITPIAKGGIEPMEYIDVVVNIGTMGDGSAQAPNLTVETSNQFPKIGEFVEMSVSLQNGKASDYGYTWYVNEVHQTSEYALNRPNFFRSFNEPGEYAVRVVVSDLKGGIASRTIMLKVGEYEKAATSSISGTVRSNDGFIQGARVIISPADVIEHTISMTGNARDWHLPTGRNNPQKFLLDGLGAPDLVLRRGEIHRFTFEPSSEGYPLSFFDHPEHEMPRVRLKMLVSPQVDKPGDKYTEPPTVKVVGGSLFSNYLSKEIATIAEFNGTSDMLGVGEDNPFEVSRPYAKSLLVDTNITSVLVRPQELNSLGLYAAHGGFGHYRDNPPTVTIHRASFWEDYTDTNATAKAYVDGVGTISPYNRNNGQLSNRWERRAQDDPTPELVIWGSGSEANASVSKTTHKSGNKTIYDHTIQIHDQGAGFEPNATMAVLHYPIGPLAMWTFDMHESLYDSDDTRFYPSPGWNRELTDSLTHYWAFDEENGTEVADQPPTGTGTTLSSASAPPTDLSEANMSHWGARGRAVHANWLESIDITDLPMLTADDGFTVSVWVKPDNVDSSFRIYNEEIFFDTSTGLFGLGSLLVMNPSLPKLSSSERWSHIAMVVISPNNAIFYVDGQNADLSDPVGTNARPFDGMAGFSGLVDEIKVYSRALSDGEVRYLAGRTFLDLSGNKYHAVPVGGDFTMNDPATDTGSSSDRPTVDQNNNNKNWPRALGDSISGEGSGRSVSINNIDSYMDLSPHISEFEGLSEGTISFWTKPSGADDRTIFSASNTDENQTHFRIKLRGNAGPVQLTAINDGVKVSEFYTNVNLSSGTVDWRHVVLVVDQTQATFWVDGSAAGSVATPDGPGATRAFLSDIEGINFMAIGLHKDLNATNSFDGKIDDFYIYDRALSAAEISFLYNLRQGRDQVPRLQALADAVGTVVITEGGEGYKELPEAQFSYGSDGNLTSDLAQAEPVAPNYGDLYFDTADDNKRVLSYYVGYSGDRDGAGGIWRNYHLAFGTPEMGETSVDRILWTKDTFQANRLTLPNDRNVTRRYVEYVVQGNGVFSSPSMDFGTPEGLFGYTAVPDLTVEASLSEDLDHHASGYVLFFLNREESAVIENPGHGLNLTAAEFTQLVRISGKGFRPEQIYRVRTTDAAGEESWEDIVGSSVEQWYRNTDDYTLRYKVSERITNSSSTEVAIGGTDQEIFGANEEAVFLDWTQNAANGEPRNVTVDFNQTLSHVVVENPGFGYSLPVSVQLIGGYPVGESIEQWFDENRTGTPDRPLPYPFVPAVVEVNGTDPTDGGITSFDIIDPGAGYIVAPTVVITGGGGNGAEAIATIDENGSISSVNVVVELFTGEMRSGRGYFNTELDNSPKPIITHTPVLDPLAKDANISVLLGGSLSEIGLCPCGDHTHMDPFIEIWDRNRSEAEIDSQGSRARAVAKVRNGVIEKVVVLDGGRGYVDPVVYVRGSPNNKDIPNIRANYFMTVNGVRQRQWRCTNLRESNDGSIVECGHIQMGLYPPEKCPGDPGGNHNCAVTLDDNVTTYNPVDHIHQTFKTTTCSGTKANYVLINDPYRHPYQDWQQWDARLVPLSEAGKIKEIIVLDGGSMYGSTQVTVSGSGGGVDLITAYDDEGKNTHVIFDDPSLRNLENDNISRPLGAGHGFVERPWSWDGTYDPTFGVREVVSTISTGSDLFATADFGAPVLKDNLGDRVVDVLIHDVGNFDSTAIAIDVDFDGSHRPDLNGDGQPDFVEATLSTALTQRLVSFELDENGTFLDSNGHPTAGDKYRSLYVEEPNVNLLLEGDGTNISAETLSSIIRLNGLVDHDSVAERGYFDLYVDDRLPDTFYYGFSGDNLSGNPAMGGKITVTEGLPGMNWATDITSSLATSTITDQNGFYSLTGLAPGLYNVAVLMEDKNFQESTFRTESNQTHVTEVIYIPGMPELVMESDQRGQGVSRMIWSREARALARPKDTTNEDTEELKEIHGVGFGFKQNTIPELIVTPDQENTSSLLPKFVVSVLEDGTLSIRILDDENSTKFNSNDRFTLSYSSSISGIDFREDYPFSQSDADMWSGSGASWGYGENRLMILPNDGNGSNYVEVPLSTSFTGEQPFPFQAIAYDQNGDLLPENIMNNIEWEIIFEGNKSEVASLDVSVGRATNLTLRSTLQRGRVDAVKVLSPGSQYSAGSKVRLTGNGVDFNATLLVDDNATGINGIIGLNITNAGSGYGPDAEIVIDDPHGQNAHLKPILGGGYLTLKAHLPSHNLTATVRVLASVRNKLDSQEEWLNLYLDSFATKSGAWWADDNDSDGLTNFTEYQSGTNPLKADTDGDGLTDAEEIQGITNPKNVDTDNDGLYDNTDSSPLLKNTASLSGTILKEGEFEGDLYLKFESGDYNGGDVIFEENASYEMVRNHEFPHPYVYLNLEAGKYWRVSAFVDSDGDQIHDPSEVFGDWEGLLSQSIASANILLKNYAPTFEVSDFQQIQEAERGETFPLAITAYDYPNQSWDQISVTPDAYDNDSWTTDNTPALLTVEVSGTALEALEVNGSLAKVLENAEYGSYQLIFTAIDASGSFSDPLIRELVILDKTDPTIEILSTPYPWPLNAEWNATALAYQAFTAVDEPLGTDLTDQVSVAGSVDTSTLGTYELSLSVQDESGRSTQVSLYVQVKDQTPPTITFSDEGPINYLLGIPFVMPGNYFSAIDEVDGNLTSLIEVSGIDDLDPQSTSPQTITVTVTDSAGNLASEQVEIHYEEPTYTLSGMAIDGYLKGSSVSFVPSDPSVDLSLLMTTTDENGAFSIQFLGDVFQEIDSNNNGALDPEEGKIVVSGGIDSSTNREFTGQLTADADSSVVTPLTSLVSEMVENGQSKETAMQTLSQAFGYSSEIDITKYNPFVAAGFGDDSSKKILQSGALVANMMKQAEAYAKISGIDSVPGEASAAISRELSELATNGNSVGALLVQQTEVENMVKRAFEEISSDYEANEEELSLFAGVATASNIVVGDGSLINYSPAEMVGKLVGRQIAVEEEVIVALEEVDQGTASLTGLSLSTDVTGLIEVANNLPLSGQFAPVGTEFSAFVDESQIAEGLVIANLDIFDPDGENVSTEIRFGNLDLNQNGISAFTIDESLRLLVGDAFDARQSLADGPIQLTIGLADTSGMGSEFLGIVGFVTKTDVSSLQANEQDEPNWYQSNWLGSFFAGNNGWLYHQTMGWLYLSSEETPGFWVWDDKNGWWWTNDTVFPYAYKYDNSTTQRGWLYFDLDEQPIRTYEFFNKSWK